jgi:hypothetical protein
MAHRPFNAAGLSVCVNGGIHILVIGEDSANNNSYEVKKVLDSLTLLG